MAKETMTFAEAKKIGDEAKKEYAKATTKEAIEHIVKTYGLKVGYKPIVKYLMLGQDADKAFKVYQPKAS